MRLRSFTESVAFATAILGTLANVLAKKTGKSIFWEAYGFESILINNFGSVMSETVEQRYAQNPRHVPGVAHPAYLPLNTGASLAAYEYGNINSNNLFVFIGGLFDGLFTLPYTPYLGNSLTNWASVQCLLTSSYSYWGFSSLQRDARVISPCISYMAEYKVRQTGRVGSIVLMGSSTGANDIMWYLTQGDISARFRLDGAVLQGPVSDQDYIHHSQPKDGSLKEGQNLAKSLLAAGNGSEPMPNVYERDIYASPLTAYRFHSLSTYGGDDDFFSVNTSRAVWETTFGEIDIPLLILWSGADEYVPPSVGNGSEIVASFLAAQKPKTRSRYSGILPNATHAVSEKRGRDSLIRRITKFLEKDVGVPAKAQNG